MAIRIFIVENHEWARQALARMLDLQPELEVVGSAASAEEALEKLPSETDILLADISLGGMSGIELIRIVRRRWPQIRPVVLSTHPAEVLAETAREAGSLRYVEKGNAPALLAAIEEVVAQSES